MAGAGTRGVLTKVTCIGWRFVLSIYGMSRVFGLVGLIFVLAVGLYIYKQQILATSAPGTTNPRSTVDVVGVKNDLLAIAQAERSHFALDGKYVSLDELISNGDISMKSPSRGPFNYSSDISDDGFVITATYSGSGGGAPMSLSIDQTMQIKTQ